MVKKPGMLLIKNRIKRKEFWPAKHEIMRLAQPIKAKKQRQTFLFDEDSSEEGLEDTPAQAEQPATPISCCETPKVHAEPSAEVAATQKRTSHKHRAPSGVFTAASYGIAHLFTRTHNKSTEHTAALEFAENRKRLGRKGRRNRRILVYTGSGFAVVLVLLLVLFVPGWAAAPVSGESANSVNHSANLTGSEGDTASIDGIRLAGQMSANTIAASASATAMVTPLLTSSPTPIPTTAPDPTEAPIALDELVEYFIVDADEYYSDHYYSPNHYEYTEADITMLAQVIYGEARGEDADGKIAVANVVMNRVLSRKFGNSLAAVITAPSQFTGYRSTITPNRPCINAARQVLINEVWVIPQDVYYFRSGAAAGVDWNGHDFYKKIDGHCFYKGSISTRRRNAGIPEALFKRVYKYAQYGCLPEDRVYRIQFMLDALGYKIEKADSYFGKGTKEALIKFQKDHGLDDDGVAGPETVKKLIEEYGVRDYFIKFCT